VQDVVIIITKNEMLLSSVDADIVFANNSDTDLQ